MTIRGLLLRRTAAVVGSWLACAYELVGEDFVWAGVGGVGAGAEQH